MTDRLDLKNLSREEKLALVARLAREKKSKPRWEPLSYAQQRLWFLDQLDPGSYVHNIFRAWKLKGALDIDALKTAVNAVVARHEALRTTFVEKDGEARQRVAPQLQVDLVVEDLTEWIRSQRREMLTQKAGEAARHGFNLSEGPLIKVDVLRLDDGEHALFLTMHHIVADGWSLGIFFRELARFYGEARGGEVQALPPLTVQYPDFSRWQREKLDLEGQQRFWLETLKDVDPVLELPADHPRPAMASQRGAIVGFQWDEATVLDVEAFALKQGTTLFMTLLAVFEVLVYRHTHRRDFVVGTPVANRNRTELEGMIGSFANTLALRAQLHGQMPFNEVLRRVKAHCLAAFDHQDLPFERLVEALKPERDMSRNPLFQVMFAMLNAGVTSTMSLADVEAEPLSVGRGLSKVDLTCELIRRSDGLSGYLEYALDLYEEATIRRMILQFKILVDGVLANPHCPISQLPLLPQNERDKLLARETCLAHPSSEPYHRLFEARVAQTPEAVALVDEHQTQLTYAELNAAANRFARRLRALGVSNETRVGVFAERSPATIAAMLGVLKAGGAYVPLDPDYPRERLVFIAEDAGIEVLVAREALADAVPHDPRRFIGLDGDWQGRTGDQSNPNYQVSSQQAAYLIYTSGSTGKPKGVVISHHAMTAHGAAISQHYQLTHEDGVLQFAALSFDISVEEIYPSFLAGARVILRPSGQSLSFAEFDQYVRRHRISVANIPTPWWHEWVSDLAEGGPLPDCLRLVIVGTEAALAERLNLWMETLRNRARDDLRWINAYGPSETTVTATFWEAPQGQVRRIPIGRSVKAAKAYVLDPHDLLAATGVCGQLCIGGEALARGYLDRPALTAEKFRPDPFSRNPGARLYATGDLARIQEDGQILFAGRTDHQVKIRGFRIETGEIEAVLQQHPAIKEALVVALEAGPGDRRLAAYLVPEHNDQPRDLEAFLGSRLPLYMVPAAFVILDQMPMTPAGKVDRKALPQPDWARERNTGPEDQPRTPHEEVLLGVWRDILGLEDIGLRQNFFQLGGHSLLATRVLARVKRLLDVNLPLRAIFEAPTVEGLAQWVEKARLDELGLQLPPIEPLPESATVPISFAQQRLWFLDQLESGGAAYNMPAVWELKGSVDPEALERALTEMCRRHQSLRAVFRTQQGQPVQTLEPPGLHLLEQQDLSQKGEPEAEAQRLAEEISLVPFKLDQGPLFRVVLLKLGQNHYRLVLIMHHIISDGWSIDVFLKELLMLHEAFSQGLPSPLDPLPVQVPDYAQWQRNWLRGKTLETQLQYWKDTLAGAPELLELPVDRPRPKTQTTPGARCHFQIPEDVTDLLREISRREGATLFMTLLAAFGALLHRYAGQDHILVGSPVAGRRTSELEALIGLFVNTLVFRINLEEGPGFAELLKRTRETALGAYSHQDLPFEQLVDGVGVTRNLSHNPLFQVFFVLHHAPTIAASSQDPQVRGVSIDNHTSRFDITLSMVERARIIDGFLEYNTDLFNETTVARMARHFINLLRTALRRPDQPVSTLSLADQAERKQVLGAWNNTRRELPGQTADELFQNRVRENPEAPALLFGATTLTYQALNQKVNAVAAQLQELGVGPDNLVGVALERGPELVVCLLAVWRAGGAYVPMDPAYPDERLAWMLEDSGCGVLVTTTVLASELAFIQNRGEVALLYADQAPPQGLTVKPRQTLQDQLAYAIYTSGSTGRPKGVQITHRCLVNFLESMANEPGLSPRDVLVSVTTISFDIAGLELFLPLTRGAQLRLADAESAGDAAKLAQLLEDATVMQCTPATWRMLLDSGWQGSQTLKMLCGGEALDPALALRLLANGDQLWNMYGPTETTIWSAVRRISQEDVDRRGVTLGKPVGNTVLHILDRRCELAPLGVAGELLIGGTGLSRGYRNRPSLTAEKFIPDPYAAQPGSRLYRTGDLAARMDDGDLRFLGRIDHQIKIRGFRIEPGDIETALARHPRVAQVVVAARVMGDADVRLTAYLVNKSGPEAALTSLADVRKHLSDAVPQYMQPSAMMVLDAFPLTPNGKVDRKALPLPQMGRAGLNPYVAPSNDAERQLVQIWSDVLGRDRIGVRDDFFELGGHSLLATQVVARIEECFDVELPLRELFEKPTVADLAHIIVNREVEDADAQLLARLLAEMDQ